MHYDCGWTRISVCENIYRHDIQTFKGNVVKGECLSLTAEQNHRLGS